MCVNKLWFPRVLSYVTALFTTISETTVLCLISGLAAVIGNVNLFLILYKNRNLRTITNLYILNLAAADTLVSVLGMPVTVVTIIKQHWVFGHTACAVLGFFTILSFITSVMSLGMISINRYFYIVKWNAYTNTFPKSESVRIVRSCFLDVTTIISLGNRVFFS